MMNLAGRSFRRRSMNLDMMKMVVWCPRLSMHLPTTSMTIEDGPSPTPATTNHDQDAVVEGVVASRREPP
jgi:hypothetical protein